MDIYLTEEEALAEIKGAPEVVRYLGQRVTSLYGEILEIQIRAAGSCTLVVYAYDLIEVGNTDPKEKGALLTFTVLGLINLSLSGHHHQHPAFGGIRFQRTEMGLGMEQPGLRLELQNGLGIEGSIDGNAIQVQIYSLM